jgi:hypothetical protein
MLGRFVLGNILGNNSIARIFERGLIRKCTNPFSQKDTNMAIVRAFVACERARRIQPGLWDLHGIFSSMKADVLPVVFKGAIVGLLSDVPEGATFTLKLVDGSTLETLDSHDHVASGVFGDGKYEIFIQPTNLEFKKYGKFIIQLWLGEGMLSQYDFDITRVNESPG